MPDHHPPTLPPPLGSLPRTRLRTTRTLPALLRSLDPRLRDVVTETYHRLGGSLGRLNPQRRRVLIQALGLVINRLACCAIRHVEVFTLRGIQQRLIGAIERAERRPYA